MPLPELTHVGERLYRAVQPWAEPYDADNDYQTAEFLHAIAAMFDPVAELVRDRDDMPGWAILFDPDLCPLIFLPFLGRLVGVDLSGGKLTEAEMRRAIRERSGFKRGTPDAIRSAARQQLTGTQYVSLLERNGGPGHFTVTVLASEVVDSDLLFAAVMEQKPAGLTFDIVEAAGVTIDEGTLTIDAVAVNIDDADVGDVT